MPYYAGAPRPLRGAGRRARALPGLGRRPAPGRRDGRRRRRRDGHLLSARTASRRPTSCSTRPRAVRVFYDLDTPVTLSRLEARREPRPISARGGLARFRPRAQLHRRRGARRLCATSSARAASRRSTAMSIRRCTGRWRRRPDYRADLSYLGTYAADRQAALEALFVEPARRRPERRFLIGGAQYPQDFPWTHNIFFVRHLPPAEHPAFFSSSRLTLNVTRQAMAEMGWCPSGRLFEAAACGAADPDRCLGGARRLLRRPAARSWWRATTDDARRGARPRRDARAAADRRRPRRERTLAEHTSDRRADDARGGARGGALARPAPRERRWRPDDVGHRAGGGPRQPHPAARLLEGAAAGRQPARRAASSAPARSANTSSSA